MHPSAPPPEELPKPPVGSAAKTGFKAGLKAGLKAGIKATFSAENIAAMVPELVLVLADRVAAQEAVKRIKIKFTKEGFAKGVAAGVMGFTEEEVALNLLNHMTDYRLQGMEDPAGILTNVMIFKLAEAQENYAVGIGYQFSSQKSKAWKLAMGERGFKVLHEYGYYFGNDPAILFEYDFIDKLAYVLSHSTDAILEHEFRFNP